MDWRSDALCVLLVPLCLGSCAPGAKGGGRGSGVVGDPVCEGWGEITIGEDGRRIIGELRCNGTCSDGQKCRVMPKPGADRQWCGCPGQPEPAACHLVKIKLPSGDWAFDCSNPCPQPQDMCTPVVRKDPQNKNRLIVQCECLTPEASN